MLCLSENGNRSPRSRALTCAVVWGNISVQHMLRWAIHKLSLWHRSGGLCPTYMGAMFGITWSASPSPEGRHLKMSFCALTTNLEIRSMPFLFVVWQFLATNTSSEDLGLSRGRVLHSGRIIRLGFDVGRQNDLRSPILMR